jgi:biopolymer transport protein ExbD/glutaredoxin
MAKRSAPEVNAGSMADIAFLLLIFFLVTTTIEKDSGIARQLAPLEDVDPPDIVIKKKNIFQVNINKNNAIFVETAGDGKVVELKDLRQMAVAFIDNGAGVGNLKGDIPGKPCNYCQGAKNPLSSDHPEKAIVSLQNDGETAYGSYVEAQNELMAAFNFLRNREAQRLFQRDFTEILKDYNENPFSKKREAWKKQLEEIRALYPLKFTEAEAKKN